MRNRTASVWRASARIAGMLVLLIPAPAPASTVAQASLSEMLGRCEFIFEGRVVDAWSEESSRGIHTWVRFEVLDVVKGPPVGPRIDLSFLGGRIGDRVEQVVGLRLPAVGERGIYFVESLQRFQVNPLYGWDQGRLRIVRDAVGLARGVSADGRPVVGIDGRLPTDPARLSSGTARGVLVGADAPFARAVSPEVLKRALGAALGRRR